RRRSIGCQGWYERAPATSLRARCGSRERTQKVTPSTASSAHRARPTSPLAPVTRTGASSAQLRRLTGRCLQHAPELAHQALEGVEVERLGPVAERQVRV